MRMELDLIESSKNDETIHSPRQLTVEEIKKLEAQNSRLVSEKKAAIIERDALRNWDLFYKRNETKFFKDRHWTTREFQELINFDPEKPIVFLELGCGVGNMVYPLIEEGFTNFFFYACDFSPRAIELVKRHNLYDESRIKAFVADITSDDVSREVGEERCHVASLVFVLSAVHPGRWHAAARTAAAALRPGGLLLLRDYARHDMAQLRFKPGHKIADNLYVRQDGTRSYYFEREELASIFSAAGFEVVECCYVHRKTVNIKENINASRIFIQAKFRKPDPAADATLGR